MSDNKPGQNVEIGKKGFQKTTPNKPITPRVLSLIGAV